MAHDDDSDDTRYWRDIWAVQMWTVVAFICGVMLGLSIAPLIRGQ